MSIDDDEYRATPRVGRVAANLTAVFRALQEMPRWLQVVLVMLVAAACSTSR